MKANLLLLTAALIWGTGFIAQRLGMEHLRPFTFGGLRFLIGGLCLLPIALMLSKKSKPRLTAHNRPANPKRSRALMFWGGLIAGGLIFGGVTFQQYGLVETTAGKAGFITGLYVIFVPIGARLMGDTISWGVVIGTVLAVMGLYLLSVTESFTLAPGDNLVLAGAVIWALHVLFLGWLAPKVNPWLLASQQAIWCGVISLAVGFFIDPPLSFQAVYDSAGPLLWGGVMSVAVGYTFQVVGQRDAEPTLAAIILQLEAVVAALCGWLFLNEMMTKRMFLGAAIMLGGMLISQLWPLLRPKH